MAEHGVGLVQFTRATLQLGGVQTRTGGQGVDVGVGVRDELVQRRVQQADRHRQTGHDGEQVGEVGLLEGRDLGQGDAAALLVVGQDHLAHGGDAGLVEEHVLGARQADALGAEAARGLGVQRGLGVGADLQATHAVGPGHQGLEVARQFRLDHGHGAVQHLALAAVDGDDLAGLEGAAARGEGPGLLIDRDFTGAGDARTPHAARHHGRVAGHAAARRDDAARRVHAVDVLGRGFLADQDDGVADLRQALGLVGVEDDLAGGRAGRGRQARRHHGAGGVGVQGRVQQLIKRGGLDPRHGLFLRDDAFGGQIDGDLQRRLGRALAVAGLQHPQTALLDRELDVLHVAVVAFQPPDHVDELGEDDRHGLFHRRGGLAHFLAARLGQGLRRADARDHVLALGVDQELAVQLGFAGRGVAGEGHARRRGLAHVAEHHGLDVDGGAPAFGDVVHAAIEFRAVVHPAGEDGRDGAPQLVMRVLREGTAQFALDQNLVVGDDLFPVLGGQLGVDRDAQTILVVVQNFLELVVADAQDHVGIHGDEAAVAVEGEAAVARQRGQPLDRLVVQAQVQHRVHHPRHRGPRARAHRDQQGVGGVAEGLADNALDGLQTGGGLFGQLGRIGLAVGVIVDAGFRRDRKAGRHRKAERGHLGQVRALAAEKVLHRRIAVSRSPAEAVHPLGHLAVPEPWSCRRGIESRARWP
ncbi:hypothetical protein D3C85_880010 [compost metagenome]